MQIPPAYDADYSKVDRDNFYNVARKVIGMILWGMIKGDQKKSPFTDDTAKEFLPPIRVLDAKELEQATNS